MNDFEYEKTADEILQKIVLSSMEEVPEQLCEDIFKMIESGAEENNALSFADILKNLYNTTVTVPKNEIVKAAETVKESHSLMRSVLKFAFAFIPS